MKKNLLCVVLLISLTYKSFSAVPIRFGVLAGMNVCKYSSSFVSSRIGFHTGGKIEITLPLLQNRTFVEAGILLSLKGGKIDWGSLGKYVGNPYYFEVPIQAGYKYSFNKTIGILGKFGPYFSYGLFGKNKWTEGNFQSAGSSPTFDAIKRFDFGLDLHGGVEVIEHIQITFGYEWGLINLYKETNSDDNSIELATNVKNRNFMISVCYMF